MQDRMPHDDEPITLKEAIMTSPRSRRRFSITLSTKAAEAFEWLKRKTDADTESEVIRNALRLHYVLLQGAEEGNKFFVRSKDGDMQIDLFIGKS